MIKLVLIENRVNTSTRIRTTKGHHTVDDVSMPTALEDEDFLLYFFLALEIVNINQLHGKLKAGGFMPDAVHTPS